MKNKKRELDPHCYNCFQWGRKRKNSYPVLHWMHKVLTKMQRIGVAVGSKGWWVSFKCVFVLMLGLGVLISAIFSLPFFKNGDLDLDIKYKGHDIVASFMLGKPISFVSDKILQHADDIFDEISVSHTKVEIISLENIAGTNITEVIFAVDSGVKIGRVSLTALSLVRSEFEIVITGQSALHLTTPLFGDLFSFDVLKFRGGITVSPKHSGFVMQQV